MVRLLNDSQLDRLSEFTANLSLVFFASMVVPVFAGIEKAEPLVIISGLGFTIGSLVISLFLIKGGRA